MFRSAVARAVIVAVLSAVIAACGDGPEQRNVIVLEDAVSTSRPKGLVMLFFFLLRQGDPAVADTLCRPSSANDVVDAFERAAVSLDSVQLRPESIPDVEDSSIPVQFDIGDDLVDALARLSQRKGQRCIAAFVAPDGSPLTAVDWPDEI